MESDSINWDSIPETINKDELYKICHYPKVRVAYQGADRATEIINNEIVYA